MKIKRNMKSKKTTVIKAARKTSVIMPAKMGLIEMIESFSKPKLPKGDLIKIYYEDRGRRNGL